MKNARIHTNNKVRETTKSGRRIQMEKHQLATQEANHKKKKKKKKCREPTAGNAIQCMNLRTAIIEWESLKQRSKGTPFSYPSRFCMCMSSYN
jgi:hypothetical protein